MNSDQTFNYSEDIMHHLYALHQLAEKDSWGSYEGFRTCLIDYVEDIGRSIFHLLPNIDDPCDPLFSGLADKEHEQLSGLANLFGLSQKQCSFPLKYDAMPDICLDMEEDGGLMISTFQNNYPAAFGFSDEAIDFIWQALTVEEMQNLTEDDQLFLVKMIDAQDYNLRDPDNMASHKRLVFGLHIPQDLKDYHDECAYELGVRLLTDPDSIDFLDRLQNRVDCENSNTLFLENDDQKKANVAFFMKQMAEIWQLPDPIEEDFSTEPEIDKDGKEFTTFMHAFYRAAANDNDGSAGLMFGTNTYKGYLPFGDNPTMHAHKALAHEFGHLVSDFMMVHASHRAWAEYEPTRTLVNQTALSKMPDAAQIMGWNNQYRRSGAYYGAVKTDFSGLPKPSGKHIYKGQLEERHADYVGETVRDMIEFVMHAKEFIFDAQKSSQEFRFMARSIIKNLECPDESIELEAELKEALTLVGQLFDQSTTFEKLEEAYHLFVDYVEGWIAEFVDLKAENLQREELRKNGDNFTTQNLFAIKNLKDLKGFAQTFFALRERIEDLGHDLSIDQESALSLS